LETGGLGPLPATLRSVTGVPFRGHLWTPWTVPFFSGGRQWRYRRACLVRRSVTLTLPLDLAALCHCPGSGLGRFGAVALGPGVRRFVDPENTQGGQCCKRGNRFYGTFLCPWVL